MAEIQKFRLMQQQAREASVTRAYEINKAEFLANEQTRLKNLAKVKKEQQEEERKRNEHKESLIADIELREARRKEVCLLVKWLPRPLVWNGCLVLFWLIGVDITTWMIGYGVDMSPGATLQ